MDHGQTFLRRLLIRAGDVLDNFLTRVADKPEILPPIDPTSVEKSRRSVVKAVKQVVACCVKYGLRKPDSEEYEHFVELENVARIQTLIDSLVYHNCLSKHPEFGMALTSVRSNVSTCEHTARLLASLAFLEMLGFRMPARPAYVAPNPEAANNNNNNNE